MEAYIIGGFRSAVGKAKRGGFKNYRSDDLAVDVIKHLNEFGIEVTVFDPWINSTEVEHEYGLTALTQEPEGTFDAIVHAVAHKEFSSMDLTKFKKENAVIYDVKGVLDSQVNGSL